RIRWIWARFRPTCPRPSVGSTMRTAVPCGLGTDSVSGPRVGPGPDRRLRSRGRGVVRAVARRRSPTDLVPAREFLEEPTGRGAPLPLVLAPPRRGAVRTLCRCGEPEERDLPDLHAGVDGDREVGHVRELEGQISVPAGIDVASG